jgi:acetoin utilization deacetylase AcuC-like enzyme
MKVVYSPEHLAHDPEYEVYDGVQEAYAEKSARIEVIKSDLETEGYEIIPPKEFDEVLINSVHFKRYINYIKAQSDAVPVANEDEPQPQRHTSNYIMDLYTPVTNGTFRAAQVATNIALTTMQEVVDGGEAYGLCRPPGHHAEPGRMGGYCYFNNAAIAAAELAKDTRVAILDIDFHHGNGTQEIFYDRRDVLYVSLHANPDEQFPYFSGRRDEIGRGAGEGYNLNLPLAQDTDVNAYLRSLAIGLDRVSDFDPDYLVLSLGFDTYRHDQIAGFDIDIDDYSKIGKAIRSAELPTILIQEGGYCVPDLGKLALSFLAGFKRET